MIPTRDPREPLPITLIAPRPVVLIAYSDPATRVGYANCFERNGCYAILAETIAEALTALSRPWLAVGVVVMGLDFDDGPCETVLTIVKNTGRLGHVRTVVHDVGGGIGGTLAVGGGSDIAVPSIIDNRMTGLSAYGASCWVAGSVGWDGTWDRLWGSCFPA